MGACSGPLRICVLNQDIPLPDADAITASPRMIAFVDVPPGNQVPAAGAELGDGRVVTFFSPLIEKLQRDGGTLPVACPGSTATDARQAAESQPGPGRRTRTRARPATPGTISGDYALESRTASWMAPTHLSQARGKSGSSSRSSFTVPRRPVSDTVPPRPHPVSAFNLISR